MTEERIAISMWALQGVQVPAEMNILTLALKDTPSARNLPVIQRIHSAWADEPERILAFFIRDNPSLLSHAKTVMGLDVLDWGEPMTKHAVEEDSFAKMLVLALAGIPVSKDPALSFKKAVKAKKYGMVLWALHAHPSVVADQLRRDWDEFYLALNGEGNGMPYLAAQVLNGVMCKHQPDAWKKKLAALAKAKGRPDAAGYFEQQGMTFASNPTAAIQSLFGPHWQNYAPILSDEELEDDEGEFGEDEVENALPDVNVAALQGAESNPTAAMLKVVYDQHPDRAHLLPIVQALQGCWHSDPARILAFFMRDNRALIPRARELMGLDVLDWVDPMWQHAVASDSWARFAVLVMALGGNPETPRQPPAGFIEAIADKHYEIAAAYMSFYGNVVGPGVSDRWTQLYWSLFETGEPAALATAQMLNGMMKRHARKVWDRDIGHLAKRLSESKKTALDTCLGYLSSEADHFADTTTMVLRTSVMPRWEAYPAEDHDDVEEGDESEADAVDAVVSTYLALADQERAGLPKEVLKSFLGMAQGLASMAGLDRDTIARAVINSGRTSQSAKDVVRDLKRLNIGV